MNIFYKRIEEELKHILFMIERTRRLLAGYKPGYLVRKARKTGASFYEVNEEGKRIGEAMKEDSPRVKEIQWHRCFMMQLDILKQDEATLRFVLKRFKDYSLDAAAKQLPLKYRPIIVQEEGTGDRKGQVRRSELTRRFTNEKEHIALDGTRVRSLAEVTIYNLLVYHNVVFDYEKRLDLYDGQNWHAVYPDFTIKKPNGEKIYWEHVGMFTDKDYREKYYKKLELYYINDIVQGNNLIITFSKQDHSIDSEKISNTIKMLNGF